MYVYVYVCMYMYMHIYYAHLASVRFEHSVCRGSLMTTYIHIYIYILFYKKYIIRKCSHFFNVAFTFTIAFSLF